MAKAKGKTYSDVKWVNLDLTLKQAAHMKETYLEGDKVLADWQNLLDSHYKVTVAEDLYNKCYSCYVIPVGDEHPNAGFILSARGSDFMKAVRGALYRHYALFDGVWADHDRQVVDND